MGILLFSIPAQAAPTEFFYRVQPHDLLSDILYRLQVKPIYGKHRMLETTLQLNPEKVNSNGDLVFPGETIRLPIANEAELRKWASVSEEGVVTPLYSASEVKAKTDGVEKVVVAPPARVIECPVRKPAAQETAVVEQKPAPKVEVPTLNPDRFSLFSANIGFGYYRLDSSQVGINGAKAILISGLSPEYSFAWAQQWSKSFQTFLNVSFSNVNFVQLNGGTLQNNQQTISNLSAGVTKKFGEDFSLSASVGAKSALFVRAVTATTLMVEQGNLNYLNLAPGYTFTQLEPLSAGVKLNASLLFSSTVGVYQTTSSNAYGLSLWVSHDLGHLKINGEPYYRVDQIKANQASYNLSEVGFLIGASYQLGGVP